MSFELGEFSFRYRSLAVHGFGISSSSNFAVLYQAGQLYLRNGPPLDREQVANAALTFDRQSTGGLAVAADDVYPIVYGGVVKVLTQGLPRPGHHGVTVKPVIHSGEWLSNHILIAFRPRGVRHEVKNLLGDLASHQERHSLVRKISHLAEQAADAIEHNNVRSLATCVAKYRRLFSTWTRRRYVNPTVNALMRQVKGTFKRHILAWKPPGAGASESVAIIVEDAAIRDAVLTYLRTSTDWWCSPLCVSSGVCGEFLTSDGHARITAGHRLDFVGGADLGQSPEVAENGICCSCAIEPRSEILIEQGRP